MMYQLLFDNISRHVTLDERERATITSAIKERGLKKRQYLLQAGEVCQFETFIAKGCLRAYRLDENGQEHIVMFGIEDWWISDLYSFLTGVPATLQIDALEDSEVFIIKKEDLEQLYVTVPKLERVFRILFQNAFVAQQRRILNNISQTAEEKYLGFIAKYPSLEQRIPQHHIASYLGLTPETISRIRKQLATK